MTDITQMTPQEMLNRAVELLDQADYMMQSAVANPDHTYDFHNRIQNLADELESYELEQDDEDIRTIELTVRVKVRGSADINDVVSNLNYDFAHEDIVETEIVEVNTEL